MTSHHRSGALPSMGPNYQSNYPPFQQGPPPSSLHNQWYGPTMPGPHSTQSSAVPQTSQQQQVAQQPPAPREEWDDKYLTVLRSQDVKELRDLLSVSNPDVIMPTSGVGPLSQAVILTLVHRVSDVRPCCLLS